MIESFNFFKSILDTMTEHIVVINTQGNIVFVNHAWKTFSQLNECTINDPWDDVNYLAVCDNAAAMGDEFGIKAAKGIRAVINKQQDNFYFEYPCHSQTDKRWFMMRTTPFITNDKAYFVISHQNITERKVAEEKVLNLSRIDGLTAIPNRRYFDEFISDEWRRCKRLNMPISLAMVDLDHFKLLNDTYGHQAGDECLKSIGHILKNFGQRTGDLSARYGGEEFALVFGNTTKTQAVNLSKKLLEQIRALKISNKYSPTLAILTASIGVATMQPNGTNGHDQLIKEADRLLYIAKQHGRNGLHY
ncbi:diguanylate cyclase [Shewanella intestini]|uniref:diguanylate cyclase n=1 Tax=Shewanella intestini TaxID=2017544 RepID=A0ABS5I5I1_9GAMM|nr:MULTISPECIES: diguanylate cyclase [Shewanella]MBR9729171.1 diguanylate cyclase [Shewanella intestini]MRG37258.1 diguanylate cyclase [Shewanella sp. XMDDZSB0408]